MVPKETMGKKFYIPKLRDLSGAKMHIMSTEDSTVKITKGDYDNLESHDLKGTHFTRDIEDDTVSKYASFNSDICTGFSPFALD